MEQIIMLIAFNVSVTNINEAPTDLSFEASASFIEMTLDNCSGGGESEVIFKVSSSNIFGWAI